MTTSRLTKGYTKNIPTIKPYIVSTEKGLGILYAPSDFDIQMMSDLQFNELFDNCKIYYIKNRKLLLDASDEIGGLMAFKKVNKLFQIPVGITFSIENDIATLSCAVAKV